MDFIERWWRYSKLREVYWDIYNGIRNLWVYFPLVWRTRDWDYQYIYDFLGFKIKQTRELIEVHGNEVDKSRLKKVKHMKICEALINRLVEDDYCYQQTYWTENKQAMHITYYHPLSNRNQNFKMIIDLEKQRREQDKELLFNIIKKHGDGWWD